MYKLRSIPKFEPYTFGVPAAKHVFSKYHLLHTKDPFFQLLKERNFTQPYLATIIHFGDEDKLILKYIVEIQTFNLEFYNAMYSSVGAMSFENKEHKLTLFYCNVYLIKVAIKNLLVFVESEHLEEWLKRYDMFWNYRDIFILASATDQVEADSVIRNVHEFYNRYDIGVWEQGNEFIPTLQRPLKTTTERAEKLPQAVICLISLMNDLNKAKKTA